VRKSSMDVEVRAIVKVVLYFIMIIFFTTAALHACATILFLIKKKAYKHTL